MRIGTARRARGMYSYSYLADTVRSQLSSIASREEAEVVAILLGELDEVGPQRLGALLYKLFEIDDLILIRVRAFEDLLDLLVVDELEAKSLERCLDFLLVRSLAPQGDLVQIQLGVGYRVRVISK